MLIAIRRSCRDGIECPTIYRADDGRIVVQGYTTALSTTVRIPAWLAPEWDRPERRIGHDLMIAGREVANPRAFPELSLPDGESAVIAHDADMLTLAGTQC